jgi:endonuclease III
MPEKKLKKSNTQDPLQEYDIPDNRHNFNKIWALLKKGWLRSVLFT